MADIPISKNIVSTDLSKDNCETYHTQSYGGI